MVQKQTQVGTKVEWELVEGEVADSDGSTKMPGWASPLPPNDALPAPADAEDSPDWLEALWKTITGADTLFSAATQDEIIDWAKRADGLQELLVPTPIIRGMGLDEYFGKPLAYAVDSNALTRAYGRTVGDISNPGLFLIGLGITITPNLTDNLAEGSPWNITLADVIVDSGGHIASEVAGVISGAAWATAVSKDPLSVFGAKMVGDISAGTGWEIASQSKKWNESLSLYLKAKADRIGQNLEAEFIQIAEEMNREDLRVATPEAEPAPVGTPSPASTADSGRNE
jgi:hypothetical protein